MKKRLVAGTMRWGSWGAQFTKQQYIEAIQAWMLCGVHEFDLANLYGDYSCEKEFGEALRDSGLTRDSVRIISKMGIESPLQIRGNAVKHYNYSKEHIASCAEQSLMNLQTDYLDLFLLHRPSPLLEMNEVAEGISSLLKAGKIRSFGVSNFLPSQIKWLKKELNIDHNQISFSLSDFDAMENGNIEAFATLGVELSAYSPIVHLENASSNMKKSIEEIAQKYNVSNAVISVAWTLKHPLIQSAVIGTSKIERMRDVSQALDLNLSLQDYFILWEAARGNRVP